MNIKFSATAGNAALTAIRDALDSGTGPGVIEFYTGTQPTSPDVGVTSQVLLGTLTLSDPCGTVSAKTLTFSAITQDSSADNSGTATWVRLKNSSGVAVFDGDVTPSGGGGFVQMNSTSIIQSGPIIISSATLSIP